MSAKVRIGDGLGTGIEAHVHSFSGLAHDHKGLLVLQERFLQFNPESHPFMNDVFGTAMNQNVAFSGTPEIIHNGGTSTEWTGSAIQGTWNFADAGKISLTGGDTGDAATFSEENPATIDMAGYTALTGKINLTVYSSIDNTLDVVFDLAGVIVGNSVPLDSYIDPGLIGTEQSFVIPKVDLGLGTQDVDGFTIELTRLAGTKPTMTFDDIQLEQTGTPAIFKATTAPGTTFHITEIRIGLADALAGTVASGTMPGLSYDKILAVSALTNGIIFRRVQGGEPKFTIILNQLGDFLAGGAKLEDAISDGTNTFVGLTIAFPEPIVLFGSEFEDFLSFSINDDLSGLLQFTAFARGAVEKAIE